MPKSLRRRNREANTIKNTIIEMMESNPGLKPRECAKILGTSHWYVYEAMREADLPVSPLNNRVARLEQRMRFLEDAMSKFLQARRLQNPLEESTTNQSQ